LEFVCDLEIVIWDLRKSDFKLHPEFSLLSLHCTPMVESFQMEQPVDKEEACITFGRVAEVPRAFARESRTEHNLPALFVVGETQDIGRAVFPAVGAIETLHFGFADERNV
jgi:hypothetical protein